MKSSSQPPPPKNEKKKKPRAHNSTRGSGACMCDAVGLKDENDTGKQEDLLS